MRMARAPVAVGFIINNGLCASLTKKSHTPVKASTLKSIPENRLIFQIAPAVQREAGEIIISDRAFSVFIVALLKAHFSPTHL